MAVSPCDSFIIYMCDCLPQEFMLELTQHQDSIGAVLRDGNELITEGRVTAEEEHEIRVQMGLLNNRWEELRIKALDRQARYCPC